MSTFNKVLIQGAKKRGFFRQNPHYSLLKIIVLRYVLSDVFALISKANSSPLVQFHAMKQKPIHRHMRKLLFAFVLILIFLYHLTRVEKTQTDYLERKFTYLQDGAGGAPAPQNTVTLRASPRTATNEFIALLDSLFVADDEPSAELCARQNEFVREHNSVQVLPTPEYTEYYENNRTVHLQCDTVMKIKYRKGRNVV